jgi:hypothetical protein
MVGWRTVLGVASPAAAVQEPHVSPILGGLFR